MIVVIKFIAPNKLLNPAKCKDNIVKSIPGPECPIILDNGGYIVHPAAVPPSVKAANNNSNTEGNNNHNDILFSLGKLISTLPNNTGTK